MKLAQNYTFGYCFCALLLGIFFGNAFWNFNFIHFPPEFLKHLVAAGFLAISVVCLICIVTKIYVQNFAKISFSVFFTLGILCGVLCAVEENITYSSSQKQVPFTVQEKLKVSEKFQQYIISEGVHKYILSVPKDIPNLQYGTPYTANLSLYPIAEPMFEFQFNYSKFLKRKKISHRAKAISEIKLINTQESLFNTAAKIRGRLVDKMNYYFQNDETAAFTNGLILGEKSGISNTLQEDFRRSGLMHILAISGSHMLLIFAGILFIISKLRIFKKKTGSIILALLAIWSFTILIDFGASVVRSCLMISVYYISYLLQKQANVVQSLGISGLIILLYDPFFAFNVGFQLSFAAVLGITMFNPYLDAWVLRKAKFIPKFFRQAFCISLSAQITVIPLMLYHFHQLGVISIVSNVIMIPLGELVIIFAFLLVGIGGFVSIPTFLLDMYSYLCQIFLSCVHFFGKLPGAFIENISFTLVELIVSYLLIIAIYIYAKNKQLKGAFISIYFLFTLIILRNLIFFWNQNTSEVQAVHTDKMDVTITKEKSKTHFQVATDRPEKEIIKYIVLPYIVEKQVVQWDLKMLPKD